MVRQQNTSKGIASMSRWSYKDAPVGKTANEQRGMRLRFWVRLIGEGLDLSQGDMQGKTSIRHLMTSACNSQLSLTWTGRDQKNYLSY